MMRFLLRRLGPWGWGLLFVQAALTTRRHLERTSAPADRARLRELIARSGGRTSRLSEAERAELTTLIRRLELGRLAGELTRTFVRGRPRRRR